MKILKKIGLALLIVFIGMQFYRPDKNSDESDHMVDFLAETNPSNEVGAILKESCYDCHSNTTNYPWYSHVAPISYWLANHVEEGKEELNFSDWGDYDLKRKDHKLEEIAEEVEEGKMPLDSYTWTHKEARLTEDQKKALMDWAKKARVLYQLNLKQD